MENKNQTIIVGGSSGIGMAVAEDIANNGGNIILVARNEGKLSLARKKLEKINRNIEVETISTDLYNSAAVEKLIQIINKKNEHIKYLVNAAGYFKPVGFLEHSLEDYDMQLEINKSLFFLTQAVANNMKRHGGGSIVNIGSMWAQQAVKATPSSAYSMQKAGLHSLTQHLAMELAEFGIRSNAVAPAVVLSTIYKSFIPVDEIEESLKSFDSFHPIGRIGTAKDISNAVSYLLSDKASWVTGEILNVDGGVMAGRNQ